MDAGGRRGSGDPRPDDHGEPRWATGLVRTLLSVLYSTVRAFVRDGCADLAAALTYYSVLSVFPALVVVVSMLGVFGHANHTSDAVLQMIGEIAPPYVVDTVRGPVQEAVHSPLAGFALVVGLAGALWTASRYVGAFGRALNRIHGITEGRPAWKRRPMQLLVTLAALVLAAAVAVMLVVSGPVAKAIGDVLRVGHVALTLWNFARWPMVIVFMMLIMAILYHTAADVRRPKFRYVSVGAAVAIGMCLTASWLLGVYVNNFASYNATYGALAGVVVFLLWLWITNLALLFGAELETELEGGRPSRQHLPSVHGNDRMSGLPTTLLAGLTRLSGGLHKAPSARDSTLPDKLRPPKVS